MAVSDPIADMLTKIRNASQAKHEKVDVTASNLAQGQTQVLVAVVLDEENDFIDCDHLTAQRGSGYMTLNLQQNNKVEERRAKLQILCEYKGATGVYNLTIVQRATHNNEDPFFNDEIEW